LISVAGTKYTTARAVAEQIVDGVLGKLRRRSIACRTSVTRLPETTTTGSLPSTSVPGHPAAIRMPADVQSHLSAAYGASYVNVLALTESQPNLGDRLADGMPVIGAELVWAVRHEMAMTLADAVMRRTPLGALGHPGAAVAARAAAIVAAELRWDEERTTRELAALTLATASRPH
jgi:glycerol-3-phosphate dehydrogenase